MRLLLTSLLLYLSGTLQLYAQIGAPPITQNLQFWVLGDSVTLNAGKVDTLYDLSGNNLVATQGVSARQPLYVSSLAELNSRPAIRFDGVDDFLTIGDTLDMLNRDKTIFVVGKSIKTNGSVYISKDKSTESTNVYSIWYASNNLRFLYKDDANKEIVSSRGAGSYEIVTAKTNRASGMNILYVNGTQIGSKININNTSYNFNSTVPFQIGARLDGSNNPLSQLQGDIAEIIIYDTTLTDSSRNLVEQYLHDKYAPGVDLGADINVSYGFCDVELDAYQPWFSIYDWGGSSDSVLAVSQSGTYSVAVTDIYDYQSSDTINVTYPSILNTVNTDTTICLGDSLVLSSPLPKNGYDFMWSTSTTDSLLVITSPGDYWVQVTDSTGCFSYSDTITVAVDSFSVYTGLGADKTACQGENLGLQTGIGIVNYLWSTGDTIMQTVVDTAGNYWVEVTNLRGCVAKDTIQINVNGIAPTVDFLHGNTCENAPVDFTDASFTTDGSTITSYHWDFGNGDTSIVQHPPYLYATSGTYNVTLEVNTDSGCTNTLIEQIEVHQQPTAGFFPSNSLICSAQSMQFNNNSFSTDGTIDNWFWDFGDIGVNDTSSLENASYAFNSSGSFNIVYVVTTTYGCSDTSSQFVSVKQSPTASYTSSGNCVNNQVVFTNTSSGTISLSNWSFGDANSTTLINPTHIYADTGVFNVGLTVKDLNGCYDTLQSQLIINDTPVAHFITDDYCVLSNIQLFDSSYTLSGTLTDWEWDVENNVNQSSNQHPSFFFNQSDSGIYQLKLKVTNSFGCLDSIEKPIGVYPLPIPNFSFSPALGLPPLEVSFTNQTAGGSTYLWDFGNGDTSTVISPTYTYQDSGAFDITLIATSIYGCIDSTTQSIQAVDPVLDVAVKNITYEFLPGSNFMKITVQLANYGLIEIQNMDLTLTTSSSNAIIEKWVGSLSTLNQELYVFSSIIEMDGGMIPDVICVEASLPNNGVDYDYSNNTFCKTLDKFELINLYPNPVSQEVNIHYILPANQQVEINLFDNIGHKVINLYNGISNKGLNKYKYNLGIFANGVYVLELNSQGKTIRKKIMIN